MNSKILEAVDVLKKHGNRRMAADLLSQELHEGSEHGERWRSFGLLASRIGETEMALEGARRFMTTPPVTVGKIVAYCDDLVGAGRKAQAIEFLNKLPKDALQHAHVLHFMGNVAAQEGEFAKSRELLRKSLSLNANAPLVWHAYGMSDDSPLADDDFRILLSLKKTADRLDLRNRAAYYYALGDAYAKLGDAERAFENYTAGAEFRKKESAYDSHRQEQLTKEIIQNFTPAHLHKLRKSRFDLDQRALFVLGLPRSGTTLVESILTSHSRVVDGGEVGLAGAALLPVKGYSISKALEYQYTMKSDDPWGDIAHDYHHLLHQRFPQEGLVVDKTLGQTLQLGLLLHAMPAAKVVWMRRDPEDVALSSFRTFFVSHLNWSWSLEDIAHYMRLEDELHQHWVSLFPDQILTVPYEELVKNNHVWIARILDHVGFEMENAVANFHEVKRDVRTASVRQVRQPITTGAIGKSRGFLDQMSAFRKAYY